MCDGSAEMRNICSAQESEDPEMKKILGMLIIGLVALTVSAETAYTPFNSNLGAGITVTEGGGLSLTFINPDGSAADFSSMFPSGYNRFGYYLMDTQYNMITWEEIDLSATQDGQIYLGSFNTGDRVAFWAANEYGDYMDSMNRDKEKGTTRDSAYVENNGTPHTTITMGTINANGWGSVTFTDIYSKTNFTFKITPAEGVKGQPLPGVAAVLLIGGAATAIRRRFKGVGKS